MARTGPLHAVPGDRWRYALLGGLASISVTTLTYWQSGSELSLSPVFLGGLLAGYLACRETGSAGDTGFRAGLIGGVPALWLLADVLGAASALSGPPWFVATGLVVTVGFLLVVVFGFAALVGALGGRVGGWLARRLGRGRSPTVGT